LAHIERIREHFSVVNRWIYMNHAAVSPITRDMVYGLSMRADDIMENGFVNSADWKEDAIQARLMYAQLIGSLPDEVAFIHSTSEGANLVANGIDWKPGDNVVLTNVDYPANIYPWMNQQSRGVEVKWVRQRPDGRIAVEDLAGAIDSRTRVLAVSFVQFINGYRSDLNAIGELCARKGVFFFVDAIQGLGAIDIDVREMKIGALAAHSRKWLLCPGGLGVLYVSRRHLKDLRVTNPGADSVVDAENYLDYKLTWRDSAERFEPSDLNPMALSATRAMLAMFTGLGMAYIENRVIALTDMLSEGLAKKGYTLHSPRKPAEKSGIVSFSAASSDDTESISKKLTESRVVHTHRYDMIRLSPHFYNSEAEVEQVLNLL
jgi:selenocysteine lyase/cysteine desulfurase